MTKAETFWPCTVSSAGIIALAFVLNYSITFLCGKATESYRFGEQVFGFMAIAGPLTAVVVLINHSILAWRHRTVLPVLGFLAGALVALPTVLSLGFLGLALAYPLQWFGITRPGIGVMATLVLSLLLAGYGIKQVVELHRDKGAC